MLLIRSLFISIIIAAPAAIGYNSWKTGTFDPNTIDWCLVAAFCLTTFIACLVTALLTARARGALQTAGQDSSDRQQGEVKWFNRTKGYGFIATDSGNEIFVHYRNIRGEGHRALYEGQRVDFVIIEEDKGEQADDVVALDDKGKGKKR